MGGHDGPEYAGGEVAALERPPKNGCGAIIGNYYPNNNLLLW
jgi:hypothetical protein